jgi:hypothetical protein
MYSEDNENIQATHEIISRDEAMMQQLEYWDPKATLGLEIRSWTSSEWRLTRINSPWKTASWSTSLEPSVKWHYIATRSIATSPCPNNRHGKNGGLFTKPLLHLSKSARLSYRYKHSRGEDVYKGLGYCRDTLSKWNRNPRSYFNMIRAARDRRWLIPNVG